MTSAPAVKLTLLFILLTFSQSYSQIVNIEKSRFEPDTSKYLLGKASLGMNLNNRGVINEQTVTFLGINANTDLAFFSKKHTYMFINFYNYISNNGTALVSAGYSHFRIHFNIKNKMSYETYAQYQYDKPRGLNYRTLAGVGLRYTILKNKDMNLITGNGLFIEQEEWQSTNQELLIREVLFLKSNNYLSLRYNVNENLKFNSILYYQLGHDNAVNIFRHRLSGEANINVKMSKKISMKTTFISTYENQPVVPVKKYLYTILNGIEVNF